MIEFVSWLKNIRECYMNGGSEKKYIIAFCLAVICVAITIVYSVYYYKKNKTKANYLTTIHVSTIGCFAAVTLINFPMTLSEFGSLWTAFQITLHSSIRMFILDGDFVGVKELLDSLNSDVGTPYFILTTLLFVLAPILTFVNVFALFKNIIGEAGSRSGRNRPFYVMSELNDQSVALAKSIYDKYRFESKNSDKKIKKPMIVFTDVYGKSEEDHYELLLKTKAFSGICLKKDISRIDISKKKGLVEFFLIGMNESENIQQAIGLTKAYKNRENTAIYVYAQSRSAAHIFDSMDKGEILLNSKIKEEIFDNADAVLGGQSDETLIKSVTESSGTFRLRRIDAVNQLITKTVTDEKFVDRMMREAKEDKTFSFTIIGMGLYGKQLLKTLVWFFQKLDYKLEINVFDENKKIESIIEQECPELVTKNPSNKNGDANYDIKFFPGNNCYTSDFNKCFQGEEKERFARTKAVFVTLGNDDMNIDVAMRIREMFDRIKGINKETFQDVKEMKKNLEEKNREFCGDEKEAEIPPSLIEDPDELIDNPVIFSVVYDENKAQMLKCGNEDCGCCSGNDKFELRTYDNNKYRINFIGKLSEQYSYDVLDNLKKDEGKALKYHLEWLRIEKKIRDVYNSDNEFCKRMEKNEPQKKGKERDQLYDANGKLNLETARKKRKWDDGYVYYSEADAKQAEERAAKAANADEAKKELELSAHIRKNIGKVNPEVVITEITNYLTFEYYKNSSMAKELHKRIIMNGFEVCQLTCTCKKCNNSRITEHMRWNAYMRSIGYIYGPKRGNRAKVHQDLVTWDELKFVEKFKD